MKPDEDEPYLCKIVGRMDIDGGLGVVVGSPQKNWVEFRADDDEPFMISVSRSTDSEDDIRVAVIDRSILPLVVECIARALVPGDGFWSRVRRWAMTLMWGVR